MGRRLTTTAGWIAVGLGAVHMVVAPLEDRRTLAGAWADGWWDTVRLAEPVTPLEAERTVVLWRTLGSFGGPMVALGVALLRSARRRERVPAVVGWTMLAWGIPFAAMLPRSPAWLVPVTGALLVAGDREPRP
ncbi:hypothetical protein GCM10009613_18920 [Pseudonocardia kongjuensis]|uniref:Uncharacterized protein n=1 Tax=Pseudonocardia kongjuensis TaxID=102227 RepID=A0ABP4IE42_9PSEU